MYLVDTNVWLERLLDQERAAEVGQFLDLVASDEFLLSDFSLHSIGIILCHLEQCSTYLEFIDDLFVNGHVSLVSVQPDAMRRLVEVAVQFSLDFDDAYQYIVAEQYAAKVVRFDGDFDRTDRGRSSPSEVLLAIDEHKDDG